MTLIGYTNVLHDFLMAEIEVLESDYVPIKNTIYYETQKCKIIKFYNKYDNQVIDDDMTNDVLYNIYIKFPDIDKSDVEPFRFTLNRNICVEHLRLRLFFTKGEEIFIHDKDDQETEDEFNIYDIGTRFNIYVKKTMLDINFAKNKKDYYDEKIDFTGFQHVYDDDGKLLIKFYHNNGIKEGTYKYYCGYQMGEKIVVMDFVNDVKISEPVKRIKRDDE